MLGGGWGVFVLLLLLFRRFAVKHDESACWKIELTHLHLQHMLRPICFYGGTSGLLVSGHANLI